MLPMPELVKKLDEDFDRERPKGFFATAEYMGMWTCQQCGACHIDNINTHTNNMLDPVLPEIEFTFPPGWTLDHTLTLRCEKCSNG